MKLLVLALTVALLFTAGESVTDSPLNKHNLCCCATGTSAISFSRHCAGAQKAFFSFCNRLQGVMSKKWKSMWLHACFNIYLLNQTLLITCKYSLSQERFPQKTHRQKLIRYTEATEKEKQWVEYAFAFFLFSGEALDCHRCVSKKAGGPCELTVETCKPEKDGCAAASFLRAPCEFLNTLKLFIPFTNTRAWEWQYINHNKIWTLAIISAVNRSQIKRDVNELF